MRFVRASIVGLEQKVCAWVGMNLANSDKARKYGHQIGLGNVLLSPQHTLVGNMQVESEATIHNGSPRMQGSAHASIFLRLPWVKLFFALLLSFAMCSAGRLNKSNPN